MYPLQVSVKYDPKNLPKLANIYTTPYLGNYVAGEYEEESGSHPGVDIIPAKPADDVHAVLAGTVTEAKENQSEGKFVIICHEGVIDSAGKKGKYYSCYLHLSELLVSKGDSVTEGQAIGKTGSTGMSTGEHLHFQIDTGDAPFHPYWPFTFKEARDLGLGFMEAVNRWLGIENAKKFTVNPLVFLETATQAAGGSAAPTESKPAVSSAPVVSSMVRAEETRIAASTTSNSAASVPNNSTSSVVAGTSSTTSPFSDVSPDSPYLDAISFLKTQGIASGQNGKFSPKSKVTRGELLKMVLLAGKIALSSVSKQIFSDVPVNDSFAQFVATASEKKIVSGYPDGTFRPNNPVTRAEGLKICLKTLGIELEEVNGPVYADVGKGDWVAPYALWNRDNEAIPAKWSDLSPNEPLTREEVASILYRAMSA